MSALHNRKLLPQREMTAGEDFVFGYGYIKTTKLFSINPDKSKTNAHGLIIGESGAGKSRLIREMIAYWAKRKKTVHIIDLQGDLGIETAKYGLDDENYMEFTARDSKYGINPFEFEKNLKNGGPKLQGGEIIAMFKKAFMPSMGSLQEAALRQLIRDTYHAKGIIDDDPETWGLGETDRHKWGKTLPTMLDMKETLDYIRTAVATGFGVRFTKLVQKNGTMLNSHKSKLDENDRILRALKDKRSPRIAKMKEDIALLLIANAEDQNSNDNKKTTTSQLSILQQELSSILSVDEDSKKTEEEIEKIQAEISTLREKIYSEKTKLMKYFDEYLQYTFLDGDIPEYEKIIKDSAYDFIDMKFYSQKDVAKVLESLNIYISTLIESGVFHSELPSIKPGIINRYNIQGLPLQAQVFFCDVLIGRIMRSLKLRGEYIKLPEVPFSKDAKPQFFSRFSNTKCDTIIVVDEIQRIIPQNKQDREDPNYGINQTIAEVRKYGGAFWCATQRVQNIPTPFLSIIATKIALKIKPNDEQDIAKLFGIKNKEIFNHLKRFGIAAITNKFDEFESVALPWMETDGLTA